MSSFFTNDFAEPRPCVNELTRRQHPEPRNDVLGYASLSCQLAFDPRATGDRVFLPDFMVVAEAQGKLDELKARAAVEETPTPPPALFNIQPTDRISATDTHQLPQEIIDRILCLTDVHTAISMRNERAKRRPLRNRRLPRAWMSQDPAKLHWLMTDQAVRLAPAHGHVHILKWLHLTYYQAYPSDVCLWLAANGQLDALQWMMEFDDSYFSPAVMDQAAWGGHLEVVKWLHRGSSW
ncbi:hypothetical protein BDZ88DRAFT_450286 [Geranomyces variabilis]|nr:hypothetical protein BDZ88DRAFT_450286 [Geranomyces variabilis]